MRSIKGILTSLVEISEADAEDIVKLRNDPNNNKFLLGQKPLTVEGQVAWTKKNANRNDVVNFKVLNKEGEFVGTASIYDIVDGRGEFGRYVITNSINAVEAAYLLLKFCFDDLKIRMVFCHVNVEHKKMWKQNLKFGFKTVKEIEVVLGDEQKIKVQAYVQEITNEEFHAFNYEPIFELLKAL